MEARNTEARDLKVRSRELCQTLEVFVFLQGVVVSEGCMREIEVQEHFMNAVFGVQEIYPLDIIGD